MLALAQSLEEKLSSLQPDRCSAVHLRQLQDRLSALHSGCVALIDSVPATGRFRFRSLLNRLDEHGRQLNAGGKGGELGVPVGELLGTLREVVTVLQR